MDLGYEWQYQYVSFGKNGMASSSSTLSGTIRKLAQQKRDDEGMEFVLETRVWYGSPLLSDEELYVQRWAYWSPCKYGPILSEKSQVVVMLGMLRSRAQHLHSGSPTVKIPANNHV